MPYDQFHLCAYRRRFDSQDMQISMHSDVPPPSDRTRLGGKFHVWQKFAEEESHKKFTKAAMDSARRSDCYIWFDADLYEETGSWSEALERFAIESGRLVSVGEL